MFTTSKLVWNTLVDIGKNILLHVTNLFLHVQLMVPHENAVVIDLIHPAPGLSELWGLPVKAYTKDKPASAFLPQNSTTDLKLEGLPENEQEASLRMHIT
jgi:hypothetical protein